jgi:DNA-binding NarL/FixJ family response regulator
MIDRDALVVARDAEGGRQYRVLMATQRCLVAAGLHTVLAADPEIAVVGQAADGDTALAAAERLLPNVVVLDAALPGSGAGLIHRLTRRVSRPAVVLLAERAEPRAILDAMEAGAAGCLLLDAGAPEICAAVKNVAAGEAALHQSLVERCLRLLGSTGGVPALRSVDGGDGPARHGVELRERLTTREADVLTLIAGGLSNKEIAAELGIGLGTVKTHLEHIYQKLQVADRTQAALQAVAWGLVA